MPLMLRLSGVCRKQRWWAAIFVALPMLLSVLGCSTRVTNTSNQSGPVSALARPQSVLVSDFDAEDANLQLDQGIGLRLQRTLGGADEGADRARMLSDVQGAIADTLVARIQAMGLPAQRTAGPLPPGGAVLLVRGQILQINQGNRTRRLGIGFGAGKSDVSAQVDVSYVRPGAPPQILQTYDADSNSGRKPGLALGAASAAGGSVAPLVLTGVTGIAAEKYKSEVAKEGAKLADHLAYQLGAFFVQQGWIAASAAPSWRP